MLVLGVLLACVLHTSGVGRPSGTSAGDARADQLAAALRARGRPITLGEKVPWLLLRDANDRPAKHALPADGRPVVIWFWSCLCRCVRDCEERIVALLEAYPAARLHFFAVDSNPDDSAFDIHRLRTSMNSPYEVFRDVDGASARHLGVDASASVAVFDGEGRLRFRGAIDNDLYEPTVSYVLGTLEALAEERPVDPTTAPSYGCRYPIAR